MKTTVAVLAVLLLSACSRFDSYADKFGQVEIGDSQQRLVSLMGTPSTTSSIEIPLLQMQQLSWKSAGRQYVIHVVAQRVVSKIILQ
jgi:hypothetical protein